MAFVTTLLAIIALALVLVVVVALLSKGQPPAGGQPSPDRPAGDDSHDGADPSNPPFAG